MGISVADNFKHLSKKFLDDRESFDTLADMKAVSDSDIPEGFETYCKATDKRYKFLSTNTVDANTGKWREVEYGGGSGGTSDYTDLENKPQIEGITLTGNKTAEDLGLAKSNQIPTVPTKVSQLQNDSGFITNVVNDLVNYYLKTETYSKVETDSLIAAIKNSRFEVVSVLPTENIQTNVIYLVPGSAPQTSNVKDEYINLDGTTTGWEQIGSTDINLSGYVTTTDLNTALANYTTTANLTILLSEKQDTAQFGAMPNASINYAGRIVQYTGVTDSSYTHGYFYECKESNGSYSWVQTNVQSSSGGGGGDDDAVLVYSQTLTSGATTLTFSNLSLSEGTRVKLYSSPFVLGLVTDVAQTSNSITLTCAAQSNDVSVMIEVITPSDVTPNGKTVTPTNDVSIWLKCADIKNSPYTELSEVLADTATLTLLINNNNASDYLKRSGSFSSDVCANSNAMSLIGANDYCADELLDNTTWLNAICNSTYFESVLNVKVPTMTSDTKPSGKVIYNGQYSPYMAWYAFGNLNDTAYHTWAVNGNMKNVGYLGYMFNTSIKVHKIFMENRNENSTRAVKTFKIQGSNDNSTWTDVSSTFTNSSSAIKFSNTYNTKCSNSYKYYRLFVTDVYDATYCGIGKLQFYGRA